MVSKGSPEELRYYLILARDPGYMKQAKALDRMLDDTGRMLNRWYASTLGVATA